ncbi:uncharacterized protein BDZ99DRAFT_469119 [Mytilinidion resinicola]|uniref:Rhodopsin domain-containing protein n=1 Tax=Mytilinidion resinicola TaxID=574789 RepID=A0A6A6Y0I9_9PEZI|nr:uncharacterized protein BDZ99DRAFT_469119 [Mytilinidion resinicola]KAF2802068.1 hypothetical protein BDZ99DRAFT_469119 [Mytilinidion resinicola]
MAFENLQPLSYGISITLFLLGTASIFLRLYTRGFILKTFGWDDVMAIFLLAVNTIQQVILFMFLHHGCGIHTWLLSSEQIHQILKWLFVEEVFYYFTHWVIKQAFLLFYLRLSQRPNFQKMVWITMGLNTAFLIINWLLAFLQCTPFDAIFHPENHPEAHCMNSLVLLIIPSILNIITDVIILVLPIPTVWQLQMSTRRKVGVLAVIGFGAAAVLISGCRIIILYQLHVSSDIAYILGKMVIIASLEIEFAIMAVNLPSVKALWNKMVGGGSSAGSGAMGYSKENRSKGYKLSSFEPGSRTGGSKMHKSRGSFTVSKLERGSESEEELFRQAGIGGQGLGGQIKVTTNVAITSDDKDAVGELERQDGLDAIVRGA